MASVVDKIRKLIAHEESARSIGNVAEAESFAAKIQELLIENKLSMSDVELKADPVGHDTATSSRQGARSEQWATILAAAAASACLCKVVRIPNTDAMYFIGRSGDRLVAISIWRFLHALALQLVIDDVKAIGKKSRMHPLKLRARWLRGFATAIFLRLQREQDRVVKAGGTAGLVRVASELQFVDDYRDSALRTRSTKLTKVRDSLAFRKGFERGTNAPLRKQQYLEAQA